MEAAGGINWVCPPNTPLRWAIIILILPRETETQLVSHPRSHQGRATIEAPLVLTDALKWEAEAERFIFPAPLSTWLLLGCVLWAQSLL